MRKMSLKGFKYLGQDNTDNKRAGLGTEPRLVLLQILISFHLHIFLQSTFTTVISFGPHKQKCEVGRVGERFAVSSGSGGGYSMGE